MADHQADVRRPRPAPGPAPAGSGGAPSANGRSGASPALRLAAGLVGVEGLALVGLGLAYAGYAAAASPASLAGAELTAGLVLLTGAVLLVLARGLLLARRWSRTPTVLLQLLALPVGYDQAAGAVPGVGAPVLAVALAVLLTLAAPSARAPFHPAR